MRLSTLLLSIGKCNQNDNTLLSVPNTTHTNVVTVLCDQSRYKPAAWEPRFTATRTALFPDHLQHMGCAFWSQQHIPRTSWATHIHQNTHKTSIFCNHHPEWQIADQISPHLTQLMQSTESLHANKATLSLRLSARNPKETQNCTAPSDPHNTCRKDFIYSHHQNLQPPNQCNGTEGVGDKHPMIPLDERQLWTKMRK